MNYLIQSLTTLLLSSNKIDNEGGQYLCDALRYNTVRFIDSFSCQHIQRDIYHHSDIDNTRSRLQ